MRHSNGPREGEFITIKSYKHDGSLHRTWRDTMVLKTSENALIGHRIGRPTLGNARAGTHVFSQALLV